MASDAAALTESFSFELENKKAVAIV